MDFAGGLGGRKDSVRLQDVAAVQYLALDTRAAKGIESADPRRAAWCALTSEDIFIKSGQSIYHFGRYGKFINKLSRQGRQEGQYRNLRDAAVDSLTRELIVYDSFSGKFLFYDFDMKYLRSIPVGDVDKFVLFDSQTAFCALYPAQRPKTGVSHRLISLKDGAIIKEFRLYRGRGPVAIGESSNKTSEKQLVKGRDRIYMSDLACPDTVYAVSLVDTLIRPAYIKNHEKDELYNLKNRTYLYLLFDTDRYAQFVRYRTPWSAQQFVLYDKADGTFSETSLYDRNTRRKVRRAWWTVPVGDPNTLVRIDLSEEMYKYYANKYLSGELASFVSNLTDRHKIMLNVLTFNR